MFAIHLAVSMTLAVITVRLRCRFRDRREDPSYPQTSLFGVPRITYPLDHIHPLMLADGFMSAVRSETAPRGELCRVPKLAQGHSNRHGSKILIERLDLVLLELERISAKHPSNRESHPRASNCFCSVYRSP